MVTDRATTAEKLNHGTPSTPRQSATVILLRDAPGTNPGIDVLLVRRNPEQRFMGGFWVFPGGAVDAVDAAQGDGAHRAAAVRELREEAGVEGVEAGELVKFSRWITPELIETRFDTHFFLARAPDAIDPRPDGVECVDLRWASPREALRANARGELPLVLPTLKHLQQLSNFASVDELLAHARELEVQPVQPRVVLSGDAARVCLPGEPGY